MIAWTKYDEAVPRTNRRKKVRGPLRPVQPMPLPAGTMTPADVADLWEFIHQRAAQDRANAARMDRR